MATEKSANQLRLPADLRPEQVTAVVDTREQTPLDLAPLRVVRGTLATGDYSIRGLEHLVAVERKSLPDFLACVGAERERFERELQRLLAYPVRALIIESTWPEIERGGWRSRVAPSAALGSLLAWIGMGIPVLMAGDHLRAGQYVARILYLAARRRWRELRSLANLCESETIVAEQRDDEAAAPPASEAAGGP